MRHEYESHAGTHHGLLLIVMQRHSSDCRLVISGRWLFVAKYVLLQYWRLIFSRNCITKMLPADKHGGAYRRSGMKIDLSQSQRSISTTLINSYKNKTLEIIRLLLDLYKLLKPTSWRQSWWKAATSSQRLDSLLRYFKRFDADGSVTVRMKERGFPSRPNGGTYILHMDAERIQTLGTSPEGLLLHAHLSAA